MFSVSINGTDLGAFAAANDDKVPDRYELKFGNSTDITSSSMYFDTVFNF
jgi:hypothetical protein